MIFGRYQLLSLIGKSHIAEVFKAKSYGVEGFEKILIIKRIFSKLSDDPVFASTFLEESRLAVSLNHANIVRIIDVGKAADNFYLAMEYVRGTDLETLRRACEQQRIAIPAEIAIFIVGEITRALDHAHRQTAPTGATLNLAHHAINFANILLSLEGEVKLNGFGLSRVRHMVTQGRIGDGNARPHLAPLPDDCPPLVDRRNDIQSVAQILWELLTGEPLGAFADTDANRRLQSHKEIHKDLVDLIESAAQPQTEHACPTAAQFYDALMAFCFDNGLRTGNHALASFIHDVFSDSPLDAEKGLSLLPSIIPQITKTNDADNTPVTPVSTPPATVADANMDTYLRHTCKDVVLLAIRYSNDTASAIPPQLKEIVHTTGGTLVDTSPSFMLAFFSVHTHDDIVTVATRAGLDCKGCLFRAFQDGVDDFGIGIVRGRVRVDDAAPDAALSIDTQLHQMAKDLAIRARNTLLTTSNNAPFLQTAFSVKSVTGASDIVEIVNSCTTVEHVTKLVARDNIIGQVRTILATVANRQGQVLILKGRAGMGKTRIADAVRHRITDGDTRILWAGMTCSPCHRKRHLYAIQHLLTGILQQNTTEDHSHLTQSSRHCMPDTITKDERIAVDRCIAGDAVDPQRHRLLTAALIKCLESSPSTMTILFIDNLADIDDASLKLLHQISQVIDRLPVLLLMAIRPGFIHGFEKGTICSEIVFPPMSDEQLDKLITHTLHGRSPTELIEDTAAATANVPGYVIHYLDTLVHRGYLRVQGNNVFFRKPGHAPAPAFGLRHLANSELHHLSRFLKQILQLASLLGNTFQRDHLCKILDTNAATLTDAMSQLCHQEIVCPVDSHTYRFVSRCVRDTIYHDIPHQDRQHLHHLVAVRLDAYLGPHDNTAASDLATQFFLGGNTSRALPYIETAAADHLKNKDYSSAVPMLIKQISLLAQTHTSPFSTSWNDTIETLVNATIQTSLCSVVLEQLNAIGRTQSELSASEEKEGDAIHSAFRATLLAAEALLWLQQGQPKQSLDSIIHAMTLASKSPSPHPRDLTKRLGLRIYLEMGEIANAMAHLPPDRPLSNASRNDKEQMSLTAFAYAAAADAKRAKDALDQLSAAAEDSGEPIRSTPHHIWAVRAQAMRLCLDGHPERAIILSSDTAVEMKNDNRTKEAAEHHLDAAFVQLSMNRFKDAFENIRQADIMATRLACTNLEQLTRIYLSYVDAAKFDTPEALASLQRRCDDAATIQQKLTSLVFLHRLFVHKGKNLKARKTKKALLSLSTTHNFLFAVTLFTSPKQK